MFDGILRGDDEKRLWQRERFAVHGTCASFMASSRADCVRGVVRLISSARTDVGENRAGAKIQIPAILDCRTLTPRTSLEANPK